MLFTVSYMSTAGYMLFQVFTEHEYENDCTLQFRSALWLLYLLPLFDVFPCSLLMMFDTIRLCCGGAEHHRSIKRSQGGSSSRHLSNQVDSSMTSD